jgi:type IV pilus assembly protein PilX
MLHETAMTSAVQIQVPCRSAVLHRPTSSVKQRGVVLIITLIMLVVISLLATLSIRNAASSESVSGNVRTTMLAGQAAEIALRYCENYLVQVRLGTVTMATFPVVQAAATPERWKSMANWDGSTSTPFTLPLDSVNQTGSATFSRPPECMVENVPVVNSAGTALSTTSTYIITARGFGPEVAAAGVSRARPTGSEVWMQSTIELQ